jgi:hypothetical protein
MKLADLLIVNEDIASIGGVFVGDTPAYANALLEKFNMPISKGDGFIQAEFDNLDDQSITFARLKLVVNEKTVKRILLEGRFSQLTKTIEDEFEDFVKKISSNENWHYEYDTGWIDDNHGDYQYKGREYVEENNLFSIAYRVEVGRDGNTRVGIELNILGGLYSDCDERMEEEVYNYIQALRNQNDNCPIMDILNNRYKAIYEKSKSPSSNDGELHRFLFLDIDGVLNTIQHSEYLIDHDEDESDEDGAIFDPEAIANLAYIINQVPDVKIVISSSWRFKGWEWMNRLWKKRAMPGKIFSFTPALEHICFKDIEQQTSSHSVFTRGIKVLEIDEWLWRNVKNNDSYYYAILDDCNDYLIVQASNAAFCDAYNGLTRSVAEKVIEILHVEYEDELKNHIINFDNMPISNEKPKFTEEIRRDKEGNITAYVLKGKK